MLRPVFLASNIYIHVWRATIIHSIKSVFYLFIFQSIIYNKLSPKTQGPKMVTFVGYHFIKCRKNTFNFSGIKDTRNITTKNHSVDKFGHKIHLYKNSDNIKYYLPALVTRIFYLMFLRLKKFLEFLFVLCNPSIKCNKI